MIQKEFKERYFKDIHSKLIEFLGGSIQVKIAVLDNPEINEYFVQEKLIDILDRRIKQLDGTLIIKSNKGNEKIKNKIFNAINKNVNPELDAQILSKNKKLFVAYEIKTNLNKDKSLNINKVEKDILRLAVVKSIFPSSKCIFILAGLYSSLKKDFEKENMKLPHLFNIKNNKNANKRPPYFYSKINIKELKKNNENTDYIDFLNIKKITEIKIRLSQNYEGKRFKLFTYEILL